MLLKPGEAPPGRKARLAIPLPGLAQSTRCRAGFDQPRRNQSRPARKPKDASPEPGKRRGQDALYTQPTPRSVWPSGRSRGSLRRSAPPQPWPLPQAGSGLPLDCLALRGRRQSPALGAGWGHKSGHGGRRPPSTAWAGIPGEAGVWTAPDTLSSRSGRGGPEIKHGVKSEISLLWGNEQPCPVGTQLPSCSAGP